MKKINIPIYYKRYLAIIIDIIITYFIVYSVCNILLLLAIPFYNSAIQYFINISSIALMFLLILYKDTTFSSGSIGKRIVGIGIYVGNTNEFANSKLKVKRMKKYIKSACSYGNIRIDESKNDVDVICNTRVDNIKKN